MWTAGSFVALLALGTVSMSGAVNDVVALAAGGSSSSLLAGLALSLGGLCVALAGTVYLLYRLDLYGGAIRRRVKALELGWKE